VFLQRFFLFVTFFFPRLNLAAMTVTNGRNGNPSMTTTTLHRAEEVDDLINAVRGLIVPYIKAADDAAADRATGDITPDSSGVKDNVLVDFQKPEQLAQRLKFSLPNHGQGKDGLLDIIQQVLKNSVNTWDQGFLDKLYASTNAILGWCGVRHGSVRPQHQCKSSTPASQNKQLTPSSCMFSKSPLLSPSLRRQQQRR
jgi:hypothetical protein